MINTNRLVEAGQMQTNQRESRGKQESKIASPTETNGTSLVQPKKEQDKGGEEREKLILEAIEKASGKIEVESKGLQFSIHEKTNQIMIKVVDTNTKEVLKELPSEKILDMMAKLVELSGTFIDEKR